MARGFDSKDVESQIEQREADRRQRSTPARTPEEIAREGRRESLLLTRARVQKDLTAARHPRHREQLEAALRHLDAELEKA